MLQTFFRTRLLGDLANPVHRATPLLLARTLAKEAAKGKGAPAKGGKEKPKEEAPPPPPKTPPPPINWDKWLGLQEKKPRDPSAPRAPRTPKEPWDEKSTIELLRMAEMFEQWRITKDPKPFSSIIRIPLVTSWSQLAEYFPGRTADDCRSKYYSLQRQAIKLGSSPFNYHPLALYPSPPSPQQKRMFIAKAYNYLNLRGELPPSDSRRRALYKDLHNFLRSLGWSFYYRNDTSRSVLTKDGEPFFSVEGEYIYLKQDIAPEHMKQIRHLIFDRTQMENEIITASRTFLREKKMATLTELKTHLNVVKRLSELYFTIVEDIYPFMLDNPQAQATFTLNPNENNLLDPFVTLSSGNKPSFVSATGTEVDATKELASDAKPEAPKEESAAPAN